MRRFLLLAAVCVLTAFFVAPLLADDLYPPDFRGDPLSYTAYWEFTSDPGPGDIWPEIIESTGYGDHELFIAQTHTHRDMNVVFWAAGQLYTLDAPGQLAFFLTNWVDDLPFKHIWVQVTYSCQVGMPWVSGVEGADSSQQWEDGPYIGYPMPPPPFGDPNNLVEYWQIMPNPNMEYVYLDLPPFCYIDEVVIDTWSTDSPIGIESTSWGEVKALFR